jgi:hypothetical protein
MGVKCVRQCIVLCVGDQGRIVHHGGCHSTTNGEYCIRDGWSRVDSMVAE